MWFVILVVLGDNKMAKDNLPKLPPLEDVLGAVTGKSGTSKDIGSYLVEAIRNLSDAERKELAKALNLAENKSYVEEPVVIDKHCVVGDCSVQLISKKRGGFSEIKAVNCKYLEKDYTWLCKSVSHFYPCEWTKIWGV